MSHCPDPSTGPMLSHRRDSPETSRPHAVERCVQRAWTACPGPATGLSAIGCVPTESLGYHESQSASGELASLIRCSSLTEEH